MSTGTATIVDSARGWRSGWQDRWRDAKPVTRTRVQVGVFLGVIVVAYHYSLTTLLQSLNLDTPLAYVGLVPFIALGLAGVRSRPNAAEPAIHDRQVDYIVGLPLMAAALAINLLLPRRLSAMFWVWRIDLLSLPFFVAGVATIIFGVRAVWRQRLAIGYLFLAWPLPYTVLLLRDLSAVTSLTLHALNGILHFVKVANVVPSTSGSIFAITHRGASFQLSVVSACSGVNGMVGFLLVGTAFGAIVSGPRLRKTLWLAGGLLLLWVINIARLLFIFWAGRQFGEHFAIDVLHPFVGLVTFNIGIVIMLLLLRPAGLKIGPSLRAASSKGKPEATAVAPTSGPLAVPAVYSAVTLVVILGMILGISNSGLKAYDLVARATGEPKLASYLLYPASPSGWAATFGTQYDWAKPYFGESSLWYRYSYSPTLGSSNLHSSLPIVADVINTSNLSSFSAYGVEACYRFHGYSLHDVSQVGLGGGITGQALSYTATGKNAQDWSIVYWIWPVVNGTSTRYERVILYMLNDPSASVGAPGESGIKNLHGSLDPTDVRQRQLINIRNFLVAFAREIVQGQAKIPQGARLPSARPTLTPSSDVVARIKQRATHTSPTVTPTIP